MLYVAIPLAGGWDTIFANNPEHNLMGHQTNGPFIPHPGIGGQTRNWEKRRIYVLHRLRGLVLLAGGPGWPSASAAFRPQDLMQRVLSAKDEKNGFLLQLPVRIFVCHRGA